MSETEAEAIAKLARQGSNEPSILKSEDGREFLLVPQNMSTKEIGDEHGLKRSQPAYLKQAVTLQTVDSLVEYVNRYKTEDTLLFADIVGNAIVGVLDFHAAAGAATPQARRTAHQATMTLPFSEEWTLWKSIDRRLMPQLEFARFIEENAADVTAPEAGALLDAVRDLQAHRKVNFTKAVRTASDNENFEYSVENEARTKGGIDLPTKFQLNLPVYFGEPPTELFAFLRWKLDEGNLGLGVALHRAEHVRQAVFKQIVLDVGVRTKCPVVFGKLA